MLHARDDHCVVWSSTSAVLSPDEWEQRRQRHNEIEVGRRKLLNQSFDHLQQLVKAPEGTKDSILRKAIGVVCCSPAAASDWLAGRRAQVLREAIEEHARAKRGS